jgi:hypothetical protein
MFSPVNIITYLSFNYDINRQRKSMPNDIPDRASFLKYLLHLCASFSTLKLYKISLFQAHIEW